MYLFASSTQNTFLCVVLLFMKNAVTSDQKIVYLPHCALCYIIDPNTKALFFFTEIDKWFNFLIKL